MPKLKVTVSREVADALRTYAEARGAIYDDSSYVYLPSGEVELELDSEVHRCVCAHGDPDGAIRLALGLPTRRSKSS